jgi:tetratricopeptide (TPR) repeat protein
MTPLPRQAGHARDTLLRSDETSVISASELEVSRIRELTRTRRHGEALATAEALPEAVQTNVDVLYLKAVNERYLSRIPEALATLQRLEQRHPRFSRLYQERGHCYWALGDAAHAIEAFQRGVNINPALPASWTMLERLYRLTGDLQNAAAAAGHVATLKRLAPEVVQAGSLFSDGELTSAERVIRAYLLETAEDIEATRLLARIQHQCNVLDEAERLLETALELAPNYTAARLDYVRVLIDRQKYLRAQEEIDTLLQAEPANRDYLLLYATASAGRGEHEKAIALYRQLLVATPEAAELHLLLGHSLKTLGRRQETVVSYRAAAAAKPSFGDAYWSLANLKTYRFTDGEIGRMRSEEDAPGTQPVDRHHLCFALGKALEDRGEYAESWRYYERGNALKRAMSRYRPEIIETNTRRQIEVCTAEFFSARAGVGVPAPDPIFIVGLPRSGSTLIEQILASHSRVEGTHELSDIPRIVLELQGDQPDCGAPRYPGVLAGLAPEDFRNLGERYMRDTRAYRGSRPGTGAPSGDAPLPYFIDKMPNNFRHLGLIHLLMPNAKVIDVRREPMACCFGNLKQLFASGQEFTYSIPDIARYYRTYLDLMQHWGQVLPGWVLQVSYEDVVEDLEGNVRRILEFCGLEFEPACLDFHRTERSIPTPSSEQVRQPLFRAGLLQWRNYEPWLRPLEDALGDALTRYR